LSNRWWRKRVQNRVGAGKFSGLAMAADRTLWEPPVASSRAWDPNGRNLVLDQPGIHILGAGIFALGAQRAADTSRKKPSSHRLVGGFAMAFC